MEKSEGVELTEKEAEALLKLMGWGVEAKELWRANSAYYNFRAVRSSSDGGVHYAPGDTYLEMLKAVMKRED